MESLVEKTRIRISKILVGFAEKIYPESQEVKDFHQKIFYDMIVRGRAILRIDPQTMFKEE